MGGFYRRNGIAQRRIRINDIVYLFGKRAKRICNGGDILGLRVKGGIQGRRDLTVEVCTGAERVVDAVCCTAQCAT